GRGRCLIAVAPANGERMTLDLAGEVERHGYTRSSKLSPSPPGPSRHSRSNGTLRFSTRRKSGKGPASNESSGTEERESARIRCFPGQPVKLVDFVREPAVFLPSGRPPVDGKFFAISAVIPMGLTG